MGKTIENVKKRVLIKLVSKWYGRYDAETLIASPRYRSYTIFAENLVAIQMARTVVKMQKPIFAGFSVLELSKELMYRFHYVCMKKWVKDLKLLYTDTDSLIYSINKY